MPMSSSRCSRYCPLCVRVGLTEELKKFSDAHRYDANAKRAYYFERQGTGVAVWLVESRLPPA